MPRLVGINHVAVEVVDREETVAFFRQIFDEVPLRGSVGNMAFLDLGDQFVALEEVRGEPVTAGHFGLVVDDAAATLERAREAGARLVGRNDFLDPSGNRWQVVDYRDIQFTKAPGVLREMGLEGLEKRPQALRELREKNLLE